MSNIHITKPRLRWLFGGVGFHNSEATMTGIMSERMKNEVIYKTFREISPTFSRVFAGYADWTKEAMDAFADYYDETFRCAGTLLYMVPGRMPMPAKSFKVDDYCESVAENLAYLICERNLTKLRYYCVTNEMSCGNTYAYLSKHLEIFKQLHEGLFEAFRRHKIDVGLLANDSSGFLTDFNRSQMAWAIGNIDEITESYCAHTYVQSVRPGDLTLYEKCCGMYRELCLMALKKEKRFILGEYGTKAPYQPDTVMRNDACWGVDIPADDPLAAIQTAEVAMAAINSGCLAAAYWTMFDYPDPMLRENGDTTAEKAAYDTVRFSGHGLSIRYNKNGLIRWCDEEQDFSSRASLYTMGYMAKLFRKGSRVLSCSWDDEMLRCSAVTNPDGSMSAAIINWSDKAASISIQCEHRVTKPFRVYVYEAVNPPYSEYNDLQPYTSLVRQDEGGRIQLELPLVSMVFLTTDYIARVPSKITDITLDGNILRWNASADAEHCYYRVYRQGKQIVSTVAEWCEADNAAPVSDYNVYSVDRWGNCAVNPE